MKLKLYILLSIILLIPFILNTLGKSTYLYINNGENDLILASSIGLFHCAYAEKIDFLEEQTQLFEKSFGYSNTKISESETINLFMEPSDTMEVFTFRYIASDGYSGFEFPSLLLWSIPTFLAIRTYKKNKNKREQKDQPNSSYSLSS